MNRRTQLDQMSTDELVEAAYETDSILAHALADDLETTALELKAYLEIGSVGEIKAALELARTAALHLDIYSSDQCSRINAELALELCNTLVKLKF